ncbi:hypothetical protein BCR36DRAFT_583145 [Piromyces finnis]|uniref:5-formyltetrahydrofolate cyclo-ligase n=1 Tax=Piromyces finnis TaxID=1754191 RepID=A0A1Y1VBE2_9FUNG|nr:hypothetical protein BCR36DRAFT_583145 [Piromyces finnis]|eukprot:ORX51084.1 hypothetical protein BCR36DRAFT_583145 [Piromyces finnis]
MTTETSVITNKKLLRNQLRNLLKTITENELVYQSNEIFKRVISLKEYQECKNISIYLHMPKGEVRTESLLKHALKSGKNCYVPYIINGTEMEMVKINSWEEFLSYPKTKWGYPEPSGMTENSTALKNKEGLDLIIVPGMAFDLKGNRLGHGKGYYDRYIERAKQFSKLGNKEGPYCVSLSLNEQLLEQDIPTNQFDVKPDIIITPQGSVSQITQKTEETKMAETEELEDWELEEFEPIAVPTIEKKQYSLQTESYINGYTPQVKILKRDKDEVKQKFEESQIKRTIINTKKSLAEREEEYRKARLKIFGKSE